MEQMSIPDLPFSILALAPFTPAATDVVNAEPLAVDPLDIDQALAAMTPSFFLSLPVEECPAGGLQLQFQRMRDFTPDGLMESQPYLKKLLAADRFCQEAEQQKMSRQDILTGLRPWSELPLISLSSDKKITKEEKSPLDNILSMVDLPDSKSSARGDAASKAGSYGALACRILDAIYADSTFRSLESSWQGLRYLGRYLAEAGGRLSILSVSPANLEEIVEELGDQVIGNPPSLLLVDRAFTSSRKSVQRLDQLARFGQEMLVPVLTWMDASFLQIGNWQGLDRLPFLPHHLENASFAKYRRFRKSDPGRWLGLACNRFLARFPYGPDNRSRFLPFKETGLPWLSPVWAVAALMAACVERTGWPGGMTIRQYPLEDLALQMETSAGPSPIEAQLSESRLDQLFRCGIMPLAGWKGTDSAFLASDVMVSSDTSLSYQALIGRVSHFILWCQDHWQDSFQAEELAERLRTGFHLFAEKQSASPAGELTIQCHDDGQRIQVYFCWIPSRKILPSGQEIVLEFFW